MAEIPETSLLDARQRSDAARRQFLTTLDTMKTRVSPGALAQDAMDSATGSAAALARKGADTVRRHPVASAALAGALGLFFARRMIGRALVERRARSHLAD